MHIKKLAICVHKKHFQLYTKKNFSGMDGTTIALHVILGSFTLCCIVGMVVWGVVSVKRIIKFCIVVKSCTCINGCCRLTVDGETIGSFDDCRDKTHYYVGVTLAVVTEAVGLIWNMIGFSTSLSTEPVYGYTVHGIGIVLIAICFCEILMTLLSSRYSCSWKRESVENESRLPVRQNECISETSY